MDEPFAFLKILNRFQLNPIQKGYKNHTKLIRKLQSNGLWNIMKKQKLTIAELRKFCETYDVANSIVRNWNKNLLKDPLWLPKHLRTKSSSIV